MFSPDTNEELKEAVNLWCERQQEALDKYGHISDWNVSNHEA